MDFINYTFKSDLEQERSMLVNVLKELDTIVTEQDTVSSVSSSELVSQSRHDGSSARALGARKESEKKIFSP